MRANANCPLRDGGECFKEKNADGQSRHNGQKEAIYERGIIREVEECDSQEIAGDESDQQAEDGAEEEFHGVDIHAAVDGGESVEIYSLTATMISEIMS